MGQEIVSDMSSDNESFSECQSRTPIWCFSFHNRLSSTPIFSPYRSGNKGKVFLQGGKMHNYC